jgi:hypothetical protein
MKKASAHTLQSLLLIALLSAVGILFYSTFFYTYFVQPGEWREFLNRHPTRTEVLAHFRQPPEVTLKPGERFQMTGWRPLLTRSATHIGYAFSQFHIKIYIFFDAADRVEEFVIATS